MSKPFGWLLVLTLLWVLTLPCSAKAVSAQEIANQNSIDKDSCGPCAIVHALQFSSEQLSLDLAAIDGDTSQAKVRTVIESYGSRPSASYEGLKRYSDGDHHGTSPVDLTAMFNDALQATGCEFRSVGMYLDRRDMEIPIGNLQRIHGLLKESLETGLPVVISFRSFVAKYDESKSRFLWNGLGNHFAAIDKVQDQLRVNEKGFTFEFIDSNTGRREFGYAHVGEARNFTAAKGDSEEWEWKKNRPFIVVTAPSLRMQTEDQGFHQRTLIIANYAIFAESVVKRFESLIFRTAVDASCGQCQLGMDGDGCSLAVRIDGKTYPVEGTDIDDHGDAHADDGFCNCVRQAIVSGELKNGKFVANQFDLLPHQKKVETADK